MAREVVVKAADVPEDVLEYVKELAIEAVEKYNIESEVAAHVKKEMDARFGGLWHCIAGLSFGSYVTHMRDGFVHLKVDAPESQAFSELGLEYVQNQWCFILVFRTA